MSFVYEIIHEVFEFYGLYYQSSDIQDAAKELVDHALNKFETELKKQLMQKIAEVEKILL